ncbi:Protein of unknown function [Cotesia congregata]|uniref:Uncharacterized protein n=1 Tax=Cotesia congregata TaxID=51543 RepID=A0A8J2H7M2_COTCN|nr:Protein of unknown function [Cotesia congregata]
MEVAGLQQGKFEVNPAEPESRSSSLTLQLGAFFLAGNVDFFPENPGLATLEEILWHSKTLLSSRLLNKYGFLL